MQNWDRISRMTLGPPQETVSFGSYHWSSHQVLVWVLQLSGLVPALFIFFSVGLHQPWASSPHKSMIPTKIGSGRVEFGVCQLDLSRPMLCLHTINITAVTWNAQAVRLQPRPRSGLHPEQPAREDLGRRRLPQKRQVAQERRRRRGKNNPDKLVAGVVWQTAFLNIAQAGGGGAQIWDVLVFVHFPQKHRLRPLGYCE